MKRFALFLAVFLMVTGFVSAYEEGIASWYGGKFQGRKTANGEIFDTYKLTAAHRSLPFNTKVKVTNLRNGKFTIVRINDRGPFLQGRIIDLSRAAAEEIDMLHTGTALVRLDVIKDLPSDGNPEKDAPKIDEVPAVAARTAAPLPEPPLPEEVQRTPSAKILFRIQVGSFSIYRNALELKKYLEAYGFFPRFETVEGRLTRVVLSGYTREDAVNTAKKLKAVGISDVLIRQE